MTEPFPPAGKRRVLVIDDDRELCLLLTEYLGREGFVIDSAGDATSGVKKALAGEHDLVILDVMLPGGSGFEVLRQVRAKSSVPVLMLTARGEELDRIVGLEIGADDYLAKPFNPRELLARMQAILRRVEPRSDKAAPAVVVVDDVELNRPARTTRCRGEPVELTSVEFDLLDALLSAAGQVVTRDDLFKSVLGRRQMPDDRSIDVHVSNLRRKLRPDAAGGERIKTIRSIGYIYVRAGAANGLS